MALADEVKNYLQITWNDPDTDARLTGIIDRGTSFFEDLVGEPIDFEKDKKAKSLLLDYCRYANSSTLELFQKNFSAELLNLQIGYQVKRYAK